ncbi:hypothetical protein KCU98_g1129, partial [Aureobasidium melanogenum]
MQRIIQELESLRLSEAAKGYFLELLKHMDNRDKEWAKVVKMWETYESGSSGLNKAMIEIMLLARDSFIRLPFNDLLLIRYQTASAPRVEMDNANAASGSVPDQDKAAKDRDAAFEQGTAKGVIQTACMSLTMSITHMSAIQEHMRLRNDERAKALKMYQDYELYSSGSVHEILHKLQEMIDKDSDFLVTEHERHEENVKTMKFELDEMKKKLEQQALGGH